MKRFFLSFNLRKTASVFAAAALLSLGSVSAEANPGKVTGNPAAEPINVNYVGATEDNFVFRLDFDNRLAEKFWLIIKNDAGEIVYEQSFKDAHITKIIRLPKEDGTIHPTFIVRTSKAQIERKFEVNRKLTEAYIVTKL